MCEWTYIIIGKQRESHLPIKCALCMVLSNRQGYYIWMGPVQDIYKDWIMYNKIKAQQITQVQNRFHASDDNTSLIYSVNCKSTQDGSTS